MNDSQAEPDTLGGLVRLRNSAQEWLMKAEDALRRFVNPVDGSFWKDSEAAKAAVGSKHHPNVTSTARAYIALANADRIPRGDRSDKLPWWTSHFAKFLEVPKIGFRDGVGGTSFRELESTKSSRATLNHFDVAHLADFVFVSNHLRRFYGNQPEWLSDRLISAIPGGGPLSDPGEKITRYLERALSSIGGPASDKNGEILFEKNTKESKHYFVTLHLLRALDILQSGAAVAVRQPLSEAVRRFCVEQCFHAARRTGHKLDVVRLTFASVIYCVDGVHIDKDLLVAAVDALADAQHESGSWPATHPIFRKAGQPWHIASHELALCLTWLYFQPALLDRPRLRLLQMMERYFTNHVIPTFTHVAIDENLELAGWLDDHVVSKNVVVGWATAIVCHFLANYYWVLSDHINRRVIEGLGLQSTSTNYVIDETQLNSSKKWVDATYRTASSPKSSGAIWPDLPPVAWRLDWNSTASPTEMAKKIRWEWSDPSLDGGLSNDLAKKVLAPIFERASSTPKPTLCSGILLGSPGTRKTTLVGVIADLLNWPMITVPASVIFDRGFDMMEARASEVFRLLSQLSGCVIFFDEFEEFFLTRASQPTTPSESGARMPSAPGATAPSEPISNAHNRTIAAFTTSAMLPRLQGLHDQGRCLVFLATNHPEKIDEAIRRPGRFDFSVTVDHPKKPRIAQYLDQPTKKLLTLAGVVPNGAAMTVDAEHAPRWNQIVLAVKSALEASVDDQVIWQFKIVEEVIRATSDALYSQPDLGAKDLAAHAQRCLALRIEGARLAEKGSIPLENVT